MEVAIGIVVGLTMAWLIWFSWRFGQESRLFRAEIQKLQEEMLSEFVRNVRLIDVDLSAVDLKWPTHEINNIVRAIEEVNGTLTMMLEVPNRHISYEQGPRSLEPCDAVLDNDCLRLGKQHWFSRHWSGNNKTLIGGRLIHRQDDGTLCSSDMVFFDCRETLGINVAKIRLFDRQRLTCGDITCRCGKVVSISGGLLDVNE